MSSVLTRLFSIGGQSGAMMDYDEAKRMAADKKASVRRKLAKLQRRAALAALFSR